MNTAKLFKKYCSCYSKLTTPRIIIRTIYGLRTVYKIKKEGELNDH